MYFLLSQSLSEFYWFFSFFFFCEDGLKDYIFKEKTSSLKNRKTLTKQQKHVSIIPTSSGEVRSFILMVPSLEKKQTKPIKTLSTVEAHRQNTTYLYQSQKGN